MLMTAEEEAVPSVFFAVQLYTPLSESSKQGLAALKRKSYWRKMASSATSTSTMVP